MTAVNLKDLLEILSKVDLDKAQQAALAKMADYPYSIEETARRTKVAGARLRGAASFSARLDRAGVSPVARSRPVPFFRLNAVKWLPEPETFELVDSDTGPYEPEYALPEGLAPSSRARWDEAEIAPQLYQALSRMEVTREVDVSALVKKACRLEPMDPVPRRCRRRAVSHLTVLVDGAWDLWPFHADSALIIDWLQRWFPVGRLDVRALEAGRASLGCLHPAAGALVVSDFEGSRRHLWEDELRRRYEGGEHVTAWLLVGRERTVIDGRSVHALFGKTCAVTSSESGASRPEEDLLMLASLCLQVDADLLRELRLLMPADRYGPEIELDAWRSDALHPARATFRPWVRSRLPAYRERLIHELSAATKPWLDHALLEAVDVIRGFRVGPLQNGERLYWRGRGLWEAEVAAWRTLADALPARVRDAFQRRIDQDDSVDRNKEFWRSLQRTAKLPPEKVGTLTRESLRGFVDRIKHLLEDEAWRSQDGVLYAIDQTLRPTDAELRPLFLTSAAEGLVLEARTSRSATRSFVAELAHGRDLLTVLPGDRYEPIWCRPDSGLFVAPSELRVSERRTFPDMSWADDSGSDAFGTWAEAQVDSVRFRMRWIEPGSFMMGSPEAEEERDSYEGPQHRVTLSQGFWMADTPCTQELWGMFMDENPSSFKGPMHPVENVSWEDATEFLARLNERLPHLGLALPCEAQWEYACRAGTVGASYAQEPNGLADIAWFDRNTDGGTHPVRGRRPNPWGLYDMLGNVDEWCRDGARDYSREAVVDPLGPTEEGSDRVFRGGSWRVHARSVRAACRDWCDPSDRYIDLGFRFVRGPSGAELGQGEARPEERAEPPEGAEPSRGRSRSIQMSTERRPGITLVTDRAELRVGMIERPSWAERIGRDPFGLFVEAVVPGRRKSILEVPFRMRWIPPGRFNMGSPPSEEGQYNDEDQHPVTLTEGFWMAETPCTQDLWEAVQGDNPSRFKTPDRPVESVSWAQAQTFLEALGRTLPGLEPRLPTEAEWEYACRAGTTEATYAGPVHFVGDANAPALDPIAWYSGNCGVDFDLSEGEEVSDQLGNFQYLYDRKRTGTRRVRHKAPNPWGLYDILGNVCEWCEDRWTDSLGTESRVDPSGPTDGSARVLRGGSWYDRAPFVRAAYRRWGHPSVRFIGLGFRFVRGPSVSGGGLLGARSEGRAEPPEGTEREAERSSVERESDEWSWWQRLWPLGGNKDDP